MYSLLSQSIEEAETTKSKTTFNIPLPAYCVNEHIWDDRFGAPDSKHHKKLDRLYSDFLEICFLPHYCFLCRGLSLLMDIMWFSFMICLSLSSSSYQKRNNHYK